MPCRGAHEAGMISDRSGQGGGKHIRARCDRCLAHRYCLLQALISGRIAEVRIKHSRNCRRHTDRQDDSDGKKKI